MTTQEKVRSFIVSELNYAGQPEELGEDFPLLEKEVVDSLGLLKLVAFLEASMDIEIEDEDIVPDNFATIADIATFVAAKGA